VGQGARFGVRHGATFFSVRHGGKDFLLVTGRSLLSIKVIVGVPSIRSLKSPRMTSYVPVTSRSTRENKCVRVFGYHE